MYPDNLILELTNTAHSCSQYDPATAWPTAERPDNVIPVPKISTLGAWVDLHSRNKITSVKVTFYVFFYNLFPLKIIYTSFRSFAWKKRYSPASFTTVFLNYSMEQTPSWEAKIPKLLKKFPAFYGTRRFITAFIRARHLSLSWARLIQSVPAHPTSRRSIEGAR